MYNVSRGCDNVISWCGGGGARWPARTPRCSTAALQHSLQYCSRSALCSWARERRWPWCGGQSFTSVGIFSVDIVFIFTNDRETCFYVFSSCHHLPLLIPPECQPRCCTVTLQLQLQSPTTTTTRWCSTAVPSPAATTSLARVQLQAALSAARGCEQLAWTQCSVTRVNFSSYLELSVNITAMS